MLPSASQSQEPALTPTFPDKEFVYTVLSWANIQTRALKKRMQSLHKRSICEKRWGHVPESEWAGPISPMYHTKETVEGVVISTAMPGSSAGLPQDAMNAFVTLWKAMHLVCMLHNTKFRMLVEQCDHKEVLRSLWISCSPFYHTTWALNETTETSIMTYVLLLKGRPCTRFAVRRYVLAHAHIFCSAFNL